MKITILGSGSWGFALARLIDSKEVTATLWGRNENQINQIAEQRCHPSLLSDYILTAKIQVTADLEEAVSEADCILFAVPSAGMRELARQVSSLCKKDVIAISCAKGFEASTHKRMTEILEEELFGKTARIGALSGPNHAEEVSQGQPSAAVVACKELTVAKEVQNLLISPQYRVYSSEDVIGVEIGGALKNIIALGVGIASGLGLGDNPKAAFMTRGLAEITRLGVAMGASPLTFNGLSGVGDLIATCTSNHSRNFRAGKLIASGQNAEEAQQEIGMVVEGIRSTYATVDLSEHWNIEMPIAIELKQVLEGTKTPEAAMDTLMNRDRNIEQEEF